MHYLKGGQSHSPAVGSKLPEQPQSFSPAHNDKILAQKLLLVTVLPQAGQYTVSAQGSSPREEAMTLCDNKAAVWQIQNTGSDSQG